MQIIDNKGLLLKVKEPTRITTVIPKAKHIGEGKVLVKWGLEEAQVLKNLRIKNVPSPIIAHYDWPGLQDRKSTRLNSSHMSESRMPSSA